MKRYRLRRINQVSVLKLLNADGINFSIDRPCDEDKLRADGAYHPSHDNPEEWVIVETDISGNRFHKYVAEATYVEPVVRPPGFSRITKNGNVVVHQYVSQFKEILAVKKFLDSQRLSPQFGAMISCLEGIDFDDPAPKYYGVRVRVSNGFVHVSRTVRYDRSDKKVTISMSFQKHLIPLLKMLVISGGVNGHGPCAILRVLESGKGHFAKDWKEELVNYVNGLFA